jgi:hypothetical protein
MRCRTCRASRPQGYNTGQSLLRRHAADRRQALVVSVDGRVAKSAALPRLQRCRPAAAHLTLRTVALAARSMAERRGQALTVGDEPVQDVAEPGSYADIAHAGQQQVLGQVGPRCSRSATAATTARPK